MKAIVTPLVVSLLVVAATTHAQQPVTQSPPGFGPRATTVLVVDHVVGISTTSRGSADSPSGDSSLTTIGTPLSVYLLAPTTRFGAHFFVTDNITIGTGIHFSIRSEEGREQKITTLGLAPRIGFAHSWDAQSAIWLRVGPGYHRQSDERENVQTEWLVGAEASYVYTPTTSFGLMVGPMLDVALSGKSRNVQGNERTLRHRTFGVTLGFLFDV